ncbi:MAG: NAD-dependent protein deacylase [Lachnospiraceae bacterium]|nr:NAD-dependent protein deacylase [Lachnospiraceae bacterium]
MDREKVERLQEMVNDAKRIVFFGGAGVSTESGIPDFRSVDGLYHQKYDYPPETILSHTFFMRNTDEFYKFYYDKILLDEAQPNAAHKKLAEMEAAGKLTAVVTQNIDGLHQKAGSKNVLELHGSVLRNYCRDCGAFYTGEDMLDFKAKWKAGEAGVTPRCPKCGGLIKPDVVLYEEGLDQRTIEESVDHISKADLLIIGGTSLVVYPAAGLIDYFRGDHLVLINKSATARDSSADLVITDPIGEVLSQINV